jgi:hypothetical protein
MNAGSSLESSLRPINRVPMRPHFVSLYYKELRTLKKHFFLILLYYTFDIKQFRKVQLYRHFTMTGLLLHSLSAAMADSCLISLKWHIQPPPPPHPPIFEQHNFPFSLLKKIFKIFEIYQNFIKIINIS